MTAVPTASTAREALRERPRRFLVSSWPLRALAYSLSGVMTGAITLLWLPVAVLGGAVVATPLLTWPLVAVERRRAALLDGLPIPDPHRRRGFAGRSRTRYADATAWREVAYLVLHATVLLVAELAAIVVGLAPLLIFATGALTVLVGGPAPSDISPSGTDGTDTATALLIAASTGLLVLVTAVLTAYTCTVAAVTHANLARLLLSPADEVRALARSRVRLIDAFEAERRRIERDLHDGAQQRLLRLGMTLVSARLELDHDPETAKPLIDQAATEAKAALAELRELVRGIHPQVLTDLGLPAAVAELADRSPIPVTVAFDLSARQPSGVESAAYFVIAETLANAAKHAHATQITITGRVSTGRLVVEIRDNGVGGADPGRGSGLTGLADRVEALDGTLTLTSPPGGPTTVSMEMPCSA